MQEFRSSVEINGQLDQVFKAAKDIYSRAASIPDIKSIKVLECSEDGNRVLSEWVGIVREFKIAIKWTAEDLWDNEAKTCTFSVVKGDYGKYTGSFAFTDTGGATRLEGEVKAECDQVKFGASIERFVAAKMKKNVDSMLEAIKIRVEETAAATV